MIVNKNSKHLQYERKKSPIYFSEKATLLFFFPFGKNIPITFRSVGKGTCYRPPVWRSVLKSLNAANFIARKGIGNRFRREGICLNYHKNTSNYERTPRGTAIKQHEKSHKRNRYCNIKTEVSLF